MPTLYDAPIYYDGASPFSSATTTAVSLLTGYNTEAYGCFESVNGRIYLTNDFNRLQVWDGVASALRDAGIAGPAAAPTTPSAAGGNVTTGTHLIRYRYIDSSSPAATYRSNASANLSYTATSASLTFSIGTTITAATIVRSTDAKVDTIQLEATAASGSDFYVVGTVANTATAISYNLADASLILNEAADTYDTNLLATQDTGVGHDQPPIASLIAHTKDRTFLAGATVRGRTVGVTLSSTSVTGTNFSTLWSSRMFRVVGDSASYLISSTTSTTMTLAKAYAGSTSTAASAEIFSRTPNTIYWSAAPNGAELPESWKITQMARTCLNGTGDEIVGLKGWQGDLIISGRFSMERLVFIDNPATGELVRIAGKFGVWNQRCFVVVDGTLFGWGPNGAWQMRAAGPSWISHPIDDAITDSTRGYIDVSQSSQFHGVYDPIQKVIRWFFVKTGDVGPRQSICIDLSERRWFRSSFRQNIAASVNAIDSSGNWRGLLSDSVNGQTWKHEGATDGVPSSSTGAYTVTVSSTTTVVNVVDSLPTSNSGLTGAILYQPSSGEERVIASNTSSTITLSSALTTAPSSGSAVYVGAIPWYIETEWEDFGHPEAKRQAHLYLSFIPTTSGTLRVRVYGDFNATPLTWTRVDTGPTPRGVSSWTNGQTYVEVSMSTSDTGGFVKIPMFMEFKRYLKASVECISPAGTLRLLDASFQPTKAGTKAVVNE